MTKLWTPFLRAAFAAAAVATGALPLAAAPPISVDVEVTQILPLIGDDFIYMKIAGDHQYQSARGRLAIDLFLTNHEPAAVTLDHVTLDFDQPNVASITLDSGLMMRCLGGTGPVLSGAGNLILPAGASCRLTLTPDPLLALPAPARLKPILAFTGILLGKTLTERDLVPYENTTATGSYRFPGRPQDLASDEFWSGSSAIGGSHHRLEPDNGINVYAYDLGVIHLDQQGVWRNYEEPDGETGNQVDDELEDFLSWGRPVYAMADGIVQDCVDNELDNPAGVSAGDPNYITVLHGEELVTYGHLRNDSASPDLCFPDAVVHQGDQLAEIGNSGTAGGVPHLHIMGTRGGHPVPLQFNDSFSIARSAFANPPSGNAPFFAHAGHGLGTSSNAFWPSGLRRRGQQADVGIGAVDLTANLAGRTITAARTTGGNLRVSLWDTGSDGEADLLDTETGGAVDQVAMTTPNGSTDGALAMRTAGGSLKIAGFDMSGTTLTRTIDTSSIAVKAVAAAPAPFTDGIVSAVITGTDVLRVIAWTVDADGSFIDEEDDASGPSAEAVKVARTFAFDGVVTAIRDTSDRLRLDSFSVGPGGSAVGLEDEVIDTSGTVKAIALAWAGLRANGDDLLVSAVQTGGNTLRLVSWAVDPSGNISQLEEASAGTIGEVSINRAGPGHVITAVADSSGDLKLIAWHVGDDGSFTRRAESDGGEATALAQGETRTIGGQQMAVTAMRDSLGDLRLVLHQVKLTD